jgi:hemolysin III
MTLPPDAPDSTTTQHDADTTGTPLVPAKPRLRGVFHAYSFPIAVVAGAALAVAAPTERARLAALVYGAALAGLFGASALYHRITWSPAARRWMRRLDHSMIFTLIAGTFTPFAAILGGARSGAMLAQVWGAAAVAVLVKLLWIGGPKWVSVVLAMGMAWLLAVSAPSLAVGAGPGAAALLVMGGVAYTGGALAYAFRRPNPLPGTFGYHEVFHACVCAAALAHFAAVAFFVVPLG